MADIARRLTLRGGGQPPVSFKPSFKPAFQATKSVFDELFQTFAAVGNGVDTYLTVTDAAVGAADSKLLFVHAWVRRSTTVGAKQVIYSNGKNELYFGADDKLHFVTKNAAGATIFASDSGGVHFPGLKMGMFPVTAYVDQATGTSGLFLRGMDIENVTTAAVDDTIDHTNGNHALLATPAGTDVYSGSIGEVIVSLNAILDITADANYAKVVDDARSSPRPVDPGTAAAAALGAAAEIYWKGDATSSATIVENKGAGGDFTENQPLGSSGVTPDSYVYKAAPGAAFPALAAEYNLSAGAFYGAVTDKHTVVFSWRYVTNKFEILFRSCGRGLDVNHTSGGVIQILGRSPAPATVLDVSFPAIALNERRLYAFSVDMATLNDLSARMDGVDVTSSLTIATFTAGSTLDFTGPSSIWMGGVMGTNDAESEFGLFYHMLGAKVDWQAAAEHAKIWDADNNVPKWWGRKGGNIHATAPVFYNPHPYPLTVGETLKSNGAANDLSLQTNNVNDPANYWDVS